MGGRLDFDFGFGGRGKAPGRPSGGASPFRLLLVGDFSGRAAARARGERKPLRRPLMVDAGDIDRAVATFIPSLQLEGDDVVFETMDDFGGDALYRRMARFAAPRGLRQALAAPVPSDEAFGAAEEWMKGRVRAAAPPPSSTLAPSSAPAASPGAVADEPAESTESTLSRLLGRAPSEPSGATARGATSAGDVIGSLLEQAVQAHVTADVGARRKLLLTAMDEALAADLRAVLAGPELRALEGTWRGAERVIRALDTDQELKIGLLDACRDDLAEALASAGGDLEQSELHKLIIDADRGWSVIAADFSFDLALPDLRLLATLGAIAGRAGAALLGDATPALVGAPDLAGLSDPTGWTPLPDRDGAAPFWQALRASPLAPSIALGLPRVLARLPYGKKTEPLSDLPFEELPARPGARPEHRVWSSAAFALAQLLGQEFRQQGEGDGWQMDPAGQLDLDDLPSHTFDADGEQELVPCTEAPLGERAAAAARARGVVPLLAHRDRAALRVAGLASIATPAAALAGAWSAADAD